MKQERIENPKFSLKQVINDINSLRKEALLIAEKERHILDVERFYDVLMKYVYYHNEFNSRIGLFPKIIFLLEKRLSEILNFNGVKLPYYYTFWFNYNPRYFSNEQLGRIINTEEVAYRVCRKSRDDMFCDILNSENKNDYNVYYFNRVIGQGSRLKEYSNSVVSVQEIQETTFSFYHASMQPWFSSPVAVVYSNIMAACPRKKRRKSGASPK